MKHIAVLGALLIACAAAQPFGEGNDRIARFLPVGDAAPISRQEARLFGPAICEATEGLFSDASLRAWGACEYLEDGSYPTLLSERGPAFILFSVMYGSFTEPAAQEVLVTMVQTAV